MEGEFLDPSRWYTDGFGAARLVPLARTFASQVRNDPSCWNSTAIGPACAARIGRAAEQQFRMIRCGGIGRAGPRRRRAGLWVSGSDDPWERAAGYKCEVTHAQNGRAADIWARAERVAPKQRSNARGRAFLPIGGPSTFLRQFPSWTGGSGRRGLGP